MPVSKIKVDAELPAGHYIINDPRYKRVGPQTGRYRASTAQWDKLMLRRRLQADIAEHLLFYHNERIPVTL